MELAIRSLIKEGRERGGIVDRIDVDISEAREVLKEAATNPKYTIIAPFSVSTENQFEHTNVVNLAGKRPPNLEDFKLIRMWKNCEIAVKYEDVRLTILNNEELNAPTNGANVA